MSARDELARRRRRDRQDNTVTIGAPPEGVAPAGPDALRDQLAEAIDQATCSHEDYRAYGEVCSHCLADAVLAGGFWIVPEIPHDERVSVGPRILPSGWIRSEAGTSEPWHARVYAAQLLAAADAVEGEAS